MKKILVTGGCGYIGAHTIVDLVENGFDVISVDDNSRSTPALLEGIEKITNKKIKNYKVNLCNYDETFAIFQENPDIIGIIHFAAFKSVGESVEQPLPYFENNLFSLINILKCVKEFDVPSFIFSSSCTVYGNPDQIPVTEQTPQKRAESPYGFTKQMGEEIVMETFKKMSGHSVLLRYFNPVGAHPSIKIGEIPLGKPANLVPAITQTAIGKLPKMLVYGDKYPTRDGTCIRDYIHVSDIAHAHTLALQHVLDKPDLEKCLIYNLGTGNGITVLEAIRAFENVSGKKLNYEIGLNRPGDVIAVYANNDLVRNELGWIPQYSLDDMMNTAWKWELKLQQDTLIYNNPNFANN
jgi:UDP-glucose 4-epimerase